MENPGQSTVLGVMVMLWTVMVAVNPWVSISVKVHETELFKWACFLVC